MNEEYIGRAEDGFTLMELIVVSAIVGILALLAIPNYTMFKRDAYHASVESDVRQIIPSAELKSSDGGLPGAVVIDGTGGKIADLDGVTNTKGVVGFVTVDPNSFFIELEHLKGELTYQFDSETGWTVVQN